MCMLQVVILSQVLACDATLGYEDLFNTQVLRFNGAPVRNLRHLAQLTTACAEPYMRFDLDYNVRPCPPSPKKLQFLLQDLHCMHDGHCGTLPGRSQACKEGYKPAVGQRMRALMSSWR